MRNKRSKTHRNGLRTKENSVSTNYLVNILFSNDNV